MTNISFYEYITNMQPDILVSKVGILYREFKGVSNLTPRMGYNGAIQLGGALLFYQYLGEIGASVEDKLIFALHTIMPAFNGLRPVDFHKKIMFETPENIEGTGPFKEWLDTFVYLEDTKEIFDGINQYEFAEMPEMEALLIYKKVATLIENEELGMLLHHCIDLGMGNDRLINEWATVIPEVKTTRRKENFTKKLMNFFYGE